MSYVAVALPLNFHVALLLGKAFEHVPDTCCIALCICDSPGLTQGGDILPASSQAFSRASSSQVASAS